VTIRPPGWVIAPGDMQPFGRLRDHPSILCLIARLRRLNLPDLVVFGSIETVLVTTANIPTGKPFHIHIMMSGITEEEVRRAVAATMGVEPHVVEVEPSEADFFRVASYAVKQTLLKKSKRHPDDPGRHQSLKPSERRELISNFGRHGWTGRLILLGMRFDGSQFRLSPSLSVRPNSAVSSTLRKPAPRQQRRASGRPL